jgi:hypothetical protein
MRYVALLPQLVRELYLPTTYIVVMRNLTIPVEAWSREWVYKRWVIGIAGSNPAGVSFVIR